MDKGNSQKSLYEQFGGETEVSELIDQFYYKVLFDKNLRIKFLKSDMTRVRYQQKRFFSKLLGGAFEYQGRDIEQSHQSMKITNEQFTRFKDHMFNILQDMEKPEYLIETILQALESNRSIVVYQGEK